jgi:hypothetical protein
MSDVLSRKNGLFDFIESTFKFEKEFNVQSGRLTNEAMLDLSHAILSDDLNEINHEILHKWGEWFLMQMAIDKADSVAKKSVSRHSEDYRIKQDEELVKVMNSSVKDLLDFIVANRNII